MLQGQTSPSEANYINWGIQHSWNAKALREVTAANFQDIYNLNRRVGELEVKTNRIKFRAQGIGGMLGIAGGAMGGPLGSVIGFGVERAIGSFAGDVLANKFYGEEKRAVNENLFLARQRDPQLKYEMGIYGKLGGLLETFQKNRTQEDKKQIQDMIVL